VAPVPTIPNLPDSSFYKMLFRHPR